MAKKIISKDIIDENIFSGITNDAEKLLVVVKDITQQTKQFAKVLNSELKENKISNSEDVKNLEKTQVAIEKTTKSLDTLNKAEKELQKQRLADIKLQQDREKAFDRATKQAAKDFELNKKQNSVYQQSVTRLAALKKELKELEITGRTNGKLYKALGQEFVTLNGKVRDAEEGVGEFFRNVGNYPQQLKAIQKELQGLEPGSARFNELAAKAGKLKDSINDAKDATKAFASESKTQTAKTLFSQIGSDLRDLDFKGAADKSRQFASVLATVSFKEVLSGIKDFGSALGNLAKTLLLNPFTAIVGGIVALGLAIKETSEAFNRANVFSEQFAAGLEEIRQRTEALTKATRDLKIENSDLADSEKERLKDSNSAQDKFADAYKDRFKKLAEINRKFEEESKATNSEAFTDFFGTSVSRNARLLILEKERKEAIANLNNESGKEVAAIRENYIEIILSREKKAKEGSVKNEKDRTKEIKKEIDKQFTDWNKYYQDLEQLRINNLDNNREKEIAQINLDTDKAIDAKIEEFKINENLIAQNNAEEIARKKLFNDQIAEIEKQRGKRLLEIAKQRQIDLSNIDKEITRQRLEDDTNDEQILLNEKQKAYEETTQKILSNELLFNAELKSQREKDIEEQKRLLKELYDLKLSLLENAYNVESENAKNTIKDADILNKRLAQINDKYKIDRDNLLRDNFEAEKNINEKSAKDTQAIRDKERKETLSIISDTTNKIFEEINKRKSAEITAQEEQINNRKTNVQRQEELAKKGLDNTLEFEKRKQAEAELERKRLQEEQEKREKRQIFFKAVIAGLENAKSTEEALQSVARATAITAIAETVAGFFKDGVENFKGKGTETSDSNLVAISKGESVVTAKGTRTYDGLATAMNNGEVEKWVAKNYSAGQTTEAYNPQVLLALRSVEKAIKEKADININWEGHDTRVETLVSMGYKKTVKHVKGRARI